MSTMLVIPGDHPNGWQFASAASGIVNSTAVVQAAPVPTGTPYFNCVSALQLMAEALGSATEFVIKGSVSGTVLWRTKIGTGGLPGLSAVFSPPLQAPAGDAIQIQTLTASVTGAVYANLQGFTAP